MLLVAVEVDEVDGEQAVSLGRRREPRGEAAGLVTAQPCASRCNGSRMTERTASFRSAATGSLPVAMRRNRAGWRAPRRASRAELMFSARAVQERPDWGQEREEGDDPLDHRLLSSG